MTPSLCFVPGWAMPPGFWNRVQALLPPELTAPADASARPVLAVGHSLGVMHLLAKPPKRLAGLVAINGFSRFSRARDHPHGVEARILRRMAQRLQLDPAATVTEFLARCGLPSTSPDLLLDLAELAAGLDLLQEGDGRGALAALSCPVLALAGGQDEIAAPALSRACFSGLRPIADKRSALQWVEPGGHILPVTHPQACVAAILDLLALAR